MLTPRNFLLRRESSHKQGANENSIDDRLQNRRRIFDHPARIVIYKWQRRSLARGGNRMLHLYDAHAFTGSEKARWSLEARKRCDHRRLSAGWAFKSLLPILSIACAAHAHTVANSDQALGWATLEALGRIMRFRFGFMIERTIPTCRFFFRSLLLTDFRPTSARLSAVRRAAVTDTLNTFADICINSQGGCDASESQTTLLSRRMPVSCALFLTRQMHRIEFKIPP